MKTEAGAQNSRGSPVLKTAELGCALLVDVSVIPPKSNVRLIQKPQTYDREVPKS